MSKAELEGLCVSCGACCHASVSIAKGVDAIMPDLRCKYLALKSGTNESCCSVYEDRFEKAKGWCLPLADAIEKGVFPSQCPYVKDLKGYVGRVVLDERTMNEVNKSVKDFVVSKGMPDWISEYDWKAYREDSDD